MIINHNLPAMNAKRQLGINQFAGSKATEKLSSGLRINRAGDDAAGLAISEKMRGQIRGLNQASRNAQDSISLIQTAEGALNETHSILQRMRELAVQSANDTNTESDRGELQKEINQLADEIDRIRNTTEFNTQKLLNGDKKGIVKEQKAKLEFDNNSSSINFKASFSGSTGASGIKKDITITITRTNGNAGEGVSGNFSISAPNGYSGADLVAAITASGAVSELTIQDGAFSSGASVIALAGLQDLKAGESVTISIRARVDAETDVSKALHFQVGANTGQSITMGIQDMSAEKLGVRGADQEGIDITSAQKATAAIKAINNAIESVSAQRSDLGAYQNRLEHTIANLDNSSENLQAAESRIRDVDMAKEMMEFTRANILSQASQSMLAQANQAPQAVLQLLG